MDEETPQVVEVPLNGSVSGVSGVIYDAARRCHTPVYIPLPGVEAGEGDVMVIQVSFKRKEK